MTATHEPIVRPVSLPRAAAAIFRRARAHGCLADRRHRIPSAPPLIVSLGVAALGLITLLALVPAWRGSRGALAAVVVTRIISAVLAVPAFFLNAPVWVMIVEGFVIAGTITALALVYQSRRLA